MWLHCIDVNQMRAEENRTPSFSVWGTRTGWARLQFRCWFLVLPPCSQGPRRFPAPVLQSLFLTNRVNGGAGWGKGGARPVLRQARGADGFGLAAARGEDHRTPTFSSWGDLDRSGVARDSVAPSSHDPRHFLGPVFKWRFLSKGVDGGIEAGAEVVRT